MTATSKSHPQRRPMSLRLEGTSSTLYVACDNTYQQLVVASRSTLKMYDILDDGDQGGPCKTLPYSVLI